MLIGREGTPAGLSLRVREQKALMNACVHALVGLHMQGAGQECCGVPRPLGKILLI